MDELVYAERIGNSIYHHQIDSEEKIVEAARNGLAQAQWYCWVTCKAEKK